MKKITFPFFLFVLFLFGGLLGAQTVTTNAELNTAISNAVPGTTITLANGTWTDVQITIQKSGTMSNPVTIKAQTPGSVFFEGKCSVKMGGSYIIFEGVVFQNASNIATGTPVIDFKASNDCNNCTVTNIKIDSYNQSAAQATSVYKWILLRGANNEVSYSSFIGKNGVGSIINDNRSSTIANYHKIHHNYFADRTPIGVVNDENDQDAIRIGSSSTSLSDSFTEVYDNYFYNFVGEIEVISNKSGSNKYYNNTFEDYSGALTLRHGDNCEVYNNFFLANGQSFSGGIRMMGENHKVYNNYIEGTVAKYPNNSSTNGLAGINIHNGILNSPLNGYYQVKNATIINNTFVNCDLGIRVGATFSSGTQNQAPQDVIIANNIMYENTNKAIQVTTQLIGAASKYENNIKQNGTFDSFGSVTATGNINVTSGLLTSGTDFYRITSGSAAIDYATGSYPFLTEDIIGGSRPANFDAGAEEFNASGTGRPYRQSDVGLVVGFGGSGTLSVDYKTKQGNNLRLYPVPVTGDYLNLALENLNLGQVQIIDMLGRTVINSTIEAPKGQININSLTKGTYIVKVQGVSKMITK
ncbi:chondroitinase-B domain-containing protein [Algibacter luteus]|uniref:chondroitinase-B domain-containing protein n=1 Tax=Algibacter luteus TaxID=1178825 RepID=UPI002596029C|nr:chondroitinase-B domain-containing protein [Algibacter luteus]WJJ97863.1 chondroitinase-B domain-containing protein [Algibacter luteus]